MATGVDGIKLHPLHIVKGSIMAKAWQAGRLDGIELEAYTVTAGEMIRHTPPEVIYHRISASARRPTLLAPLWCENRWTGMVELDRYLNQQGAQGSALGRSWVAPVLSEKYERDVGNNAGHRAPAIYARLAFIVTRGVLITNSTSRAPSAAIVPARTKALSNLPVDCTI